MNVVILKNNLKEGLSVIAGALKESGNLPVLKNILIETFDGKVKLSATDLERGITHTVSGKVLEDGSVTIPFGVFSQLINNIPSERINLEKKGEALAITTDNFNAKITTTPKDDFPIIPEISVHAKNKFVCETSVLFDAFSSVVSACQISDIRPELSGVLFTYKGDECKCVATDSFRLAEKKIHAKKIETEIDEVVSFIIPLKTIQEAVRIFGAIKSQPITIAFDEHQVLFITQDTKLISRLIEGKFPDYDVIIPKSFETEITLEKTELLPALKLTSSLSNKLHEIKLVSDDSNKNIRIYSSSQEFGESEYLLPAKIKGEKIQITFNWRFIIDGVKNIETDTVNIGCNGEEKPSIFYPAGDTSFLYVIMPIKSSS